MNNNSKNPAQRLRTGGAGKFLSAVSDETYTNPNQSGNDPLWDTCREARDVNPTVYTPRFNANRLRAATAQLRDERGRWWLQCCPHCGGWVKLCAYSSGSIRASSYGEAPYCSAVDSINRWLRDQGFQSEGGAAC